MISIIKCSVLSKNKWKALNRWLDLWLNKSGTLSNSSEKSPHLYASLVVQSSRPEYHTFCQRHSTLMNCDYCSTFKLWMGHSLVNGGVWKVDQRYSIPGLPNLSTCVHLCLCFRQLRLEMPWGYRGWGCGG